MYLHIPQKKHFTPKLVAVATLLFVTAASEAYTLNIATGTRALYLRVGDGAWTGANYNANTAGATNGGAITLVNLTLAANVLGNGVAQNMNSTADLTSRYDGFTFCAANQVYIGGFFRLPTTTQNAVLSVTAPANLTNATGDVIPISQISWTSSGNGDAATTVQPVPAGTFSGGSQILANNFLRNTWRESCHTFSYANSNIVAAGTYNARVRYTLTAP